MCFLWDWRVTNRAASPTGQKMFALPWIRLISRGEEDLLFLDFKPQTLPRIIRSEKLKQVLPWWVNALKPKPCAWGANETRVAGGQDGHDILWPCSVTKWEEAKGKNKGMQMDEWWKANGVAALRESDGRKQRKRQEKEVRKERCWCSAVTIGASGVVKILQQRPSPLLCNVHLILQILDETEAENKLIKMYLGLIVSSFSTPSFSPCSGLLPLCHSHWGPPRLPPLPSHSCRPAPPSRTGSLSLLQAALVDTQTVEDGEEETMKEQKEFQHWTQQQHKQKSSLPVASVAQTPCNRHKDRCTAVCSDTENRERPALR